MSTNSLSEHSTAPTAGLRMIGFGAASIDWRREFDPSASRRQSQRL
jgi:hypothetical protein